LVIAEASRYIRRYGASEHEQQGDSSAEPTQLQSQRQQWLQKSLSDLIATNSLIKRCVDEKLLVMLRSVSTSESDCFETLLQFICERRFDAGFELIQTLNAQQLKWPFSAPLIIVYLNLEQYERLLETVDSALLTEKHLALARITDEFLLTAKAEALYGIADQSSLQSFDQIMNSEHFHNEIWTFLHLSKLAKSDCSNDEFVKELDEAKVDGDERYCWMAAKALSNNQIDGAGINAKKALSGQLTSWRVMLLLAEVLLRLDPNDPHATSLLLKVIKQNGPSSRIYYRLAQSLAERSPSKALGCLEMALKIRPQYLEVVQLRDRLLGLEQRKEEQLKNVERFIGVQPRCVWALRRCALLKLQLNMI
uniref:TPR_REGION domain-containing protein n=1 Tax=Anisakis simplex TaxID=6269 RepID=A0A0M3J3K4_ANISI